MSAALEVGVVYLVSIARHIFGEHGILRLAPLRKREDKEPGQEELDSAQEPL